MFEEFNTFFENGIRSLSVKPDEYYLSDIRNMIDSVRATIKTFKNHPSVLVIKQSKIFQWTRTFIFQRLMSLTINKLIKRKVPLEKSQQMLE